MHPRYWAYCCSKGLLWLIFRLGFGLEVRGREHVPAQGPFILASNHVSFLDPPLLGAACPRRLSFLARDTLFRHWLLGAYLRSVHVIPLKRDEGDLGAIREAVHRLRRGEAVAIFPEGGRQRSGALGRARRGVGLIAMTAQVPVVPVLVQGTFEAMPRGASCLSRAKIRVVFGPPIPYTTGSVVPPGTAGRPRVGQEQLADAVTQAWHQLRAHMSAHKECIR